MSGWLIPDDDLSGEAESQLPTQSMGPARAWVAQAWILARSGDDAGAQQALRSAQRVVVLFEHSGPNLVAVMVGVGTHRIVLEHAIKLADRVPLHAQRR